MPVKGRVVEDRNGRLMIEIKEGEEEPHMPEGIEYEKKFVQNIHTVQIGR